ncbi:MAG: 3'-5' exonuclease [Bacteroidota bacterium]|nr:3'-5' exonuclease [Bacteroidota bacterium]
MKLFFFDVETTGTLYWKHGIHQLSGKIVIDGEEKERFDFKVRPNPKAVIEQQALDVSGVTKEQIMAYTPMEEVFKELIGMMSKYVDKWTSKKTGRFHLTGFNSTQFDNPFLKAWFAQNGESYFYSWFWYDSLDVMTMAALKFAPNRHSLNGFKLMNVAQYLGIQIEEDKLHDAMYDIDITEKCFNILYKELIGDDNHRTIQ